MNLRPCWIHIYEIQLTDLSSDNDLVPDAFKNIRSTPFPSQKTARVLNTRERIVVLSGSSTVELLMWGEDSIPISRQKIRCSTATRGFSGSSEQRSIFVFSFSLLDLLGHPFYGTLYPDI